MPNFPLPNNVRSALQKRIVELALRPYNSTRRQFPLTVEEVQAMALDTNRIERLDRLQKDGIKTIVKFNELRFGFLRSQGMQRSTIVQLKLPQHIFVPHNTEWEVSITKFLPNETGYLMPDTKVLSDEKLKALMTWVQNALRQKRILELAQLLSMEVLIWKWDKVAPTVAHLHEVWPIVPGLMGPNMVHAYDRTWAEEWAQKMRDPPRINKQRYKVLPALRARYEKPMVAVDTAINMGLMMGKDVELKGGVIGAIDKWENFPSDLRLGPFPDLP